ncbi:oxalurate catabolism protein HpxZ [Solwaraspora sp. WMMD791]|uniref:oxalurate catabolism protein HpxZ n=1 Tax=Solwaraspora sp. WMMD791 TaxID=3016086 RepID=UPI00249BD896|nr:oxalurate catabolism protein HpxZ [Solwaraspora sp. WMMD791]WFE26774.1 oxalurate catabolism protein HpxZ [Solwaraspora sp. WMMD791]
MSAEVNRPDGYAEVNRPDVCAEVREAFDSYEKALVDNDVAAIVGWFWSSEHTVRFGIADRQYGIDEQRAWRAAQPPLPPGRRLYEVRVTTFGADFAVVTCRFDYPGGAVHPGRQSQTWVRGPAGWRIVSAHVSQPAAILHLSTDNSDISSR